MEARARVARKSTVGRRLLHPFQILSFNMPSPRQPQVFRSNVFRSIDEIIRPIPLSIKRKITNNWYQKIWIPKLVIYLHDAMVIRNAN
jgi:hypothetical protein